jgi:hypothetical protein
MHPDGMGWSWVELQDTPAYVRRFCWDLLQVKRKAEHDAVEDAKRRSGRGDRRGA